MLVRFLKARRLIMYVNLKINREVNSWYGSIREMPGEPGAPPFHGRPPLPCLSPCIKTPQTLYFACFPSLKIKTHTNTITFILSIFILPNFFIILFLHQGTNFLSKMCSPSNIDIIHMFCFPKKHIKIIHFLYK